METPTRGGGSDLRNLISTGESNRLRFRRISDSRNLIFTGESNTLRISIILGSLYDSYRRTLLDSLPEKMISVNFTMLGRPQVGG